MTAKKKDDQANGEPEEEMAVIAYVYLPENNPDGAQLPGVPNRDLHQSEVDAMPKWVQKSIAHSPMYLKAGEDTDPKETDNT